MAAPLCYFYWPRQIVLCLSIFCDDFIEFRIFWGFVILCLVLKFMLVSCFVFSSSLNAVLKWVVHWSLTDHLQWLSLGWLLQSLVNTLVQSFEPDMQCKILKDSLVAFETRIVWSDLTHHFKKLESGLGAWNMEESGFWTNSAILVAIQIFVHVTIFFAIKW